MSALSAYMRNTLADHLLRGAPYTPPDGVWVGLHTGDPGTNGGANEVVGGNYARVRIRRDQFLAAANGICVLNEHILFPTAGAVWGDLTHLTVWDAETGGNCLYFGALASPRRVEGGETFRLPASVFALGFR